MKKTVSILLALIMLLSLLPCASAEGSVVEVTKNASIRSEGNYNAKKLRLAEAGEQFELLAEEGKWYKISFDGSSVGYLPADSCKLTKSSGESANKEATANTDNTASADKPASSAGTDTAKVIKADKIKFDEKTINLAPGYATRARYTVTPSNANETLTWKSANEKIATVDAQGKITGLKKGSCKITVYAENGKRQKAQVAVKVDEYDMVFTSREPQKGRYYYGSGRYTITGKVKTGNVSIPSISIYMMASVIGGNASEQFDVTPVKTGTDVITVTAGRVKTTIKVLVLPETFDPPEIKDLGIGEGVVIEKGYEGVFNGHTYRYFRNDLSWSAAKEFCEKQGGYLVTITTNEEQKFIEMLCNSNDRPWIGLCREKKNSSKWKWVSGEAYGYAHWNSGEPNDYGGNEPVTVLADGFRWNDMADAKSTSCNGFICEWDSIIANVAE